MIAEVSHEQRAQLNAISSYTEDVIYEAEQGNFDKDEFL